MKTEDFQDLSNKYGVSVTKIQNWLKYRKNKGVEKTITKQNKVFIIKNLIF